MAQLILQAENPSILEQLKNILSLMKGIKIISSDVPVKSIDKIDFPNTTTLAAMKEVESGHDAGTVCMDSLESFMASMEE